MLTKMNDTNWTEIGRVDDIPAGGARVVNTPQGRIALFRTVDDKVWALHDKCPHKGGPLSQGMVYGHKVACPMHDLSLDLESGEAVAEAPLGGVLDKPMPEGFALDPPHDEERPASTSGR